LQPGVGRLEFVGGAELEVDLRGPPLFGQGARDIVVLLQLLIFRSGGIDDPTQNGERRVTSPAITLDVFLDLLRLRGPWHTPTLLREVQLSLFLLLPPRVKDSLFPPAVSFVNIIGVRHLSD